MGKFFEDKFNKGEKNPCNCPECRIGSQPEIDAEEISVDIQIGDPNEIINECFAAISNADSPEEVYEIIQGCFYEGVVFGSKDELLNDIQMKIEMLNSIENGFVD